MTDPARWHGWLRISLNGKWKALLYHYSPSTVACPSNPDHYQKTCIKYAFYIYIEIKSGWKTLLVLRSPQQLNNTSGNRVLLLHVFPFHIFIFFPLTGFLWPPNLHFSGSSWRKTNKEPSKALPRASIQMWSTVWQMKHWSIPTPFPFSIVEKYCLARLADSLSELHVFRSITASQSTAVLRLKAWLQRVMTFDSVWGRRFSLFAVRQKRRNLLNWIQGSNGNNNKCVQFSPE